MSRDSERLFASGDLNGTLDNLRAAIVREIDELKADYLLKVSEADLVNSLTSRSEIEPLKLFRESMSIDGPREVDITFEGEQAFQYGEDRVTVRGTTFTVVIPFSGTPNLFQLRPPTWNLSAARGSIVGQELHLTFSGPDMNAQRVREEIDYAVRQIEENIGWQAESLDRFNKGLATLISERIHIRKQKLTKDMNLVESLGIPIRRRDLPETYAVPAVRQRPRIELPKVVAGAFKPEPVLVDEHYEFILKVVQDMALVMERSPTAFAKMDEEHLRDHFLVQLNGHFGGEATGETFNSLGKTDVLIRHEGKNVFIAECKVWRGDKAFIETIDQLLGYASWRDTKTAIILFNRNRDFSNVLGKLPTLIKSHPNHKRELPVTGETRFRNVLHHRDDKNRELILTVVAFDVSTPAEPQVQ